MLISRSDPFDVAFFRAAKWFLWFLGLWPLNPTKPLSAFATFLHISILFTALVGEYRFTWLIRSQPLEMLWLICPILMKSVTWVKIVLIVIQRKKVAKLMSEIFKHLIEDSKDLQKDAMISKGTFLAAGGTLLLFAVSISTSSSYAAMPLITWTYHRFSGGTNGTWVSLPFFALPYKDMTQGGSKTLYAFIFCALFHSGNVTVVGNSAIDGVYMYCCMYISISYQCLQIDFRRVFEKHTNGGLHVHDSDALYKDLSLIVRREQNISTMFQLFNGVYKSIIFTDILFAGIRLGVVLFELLLVPGKLKFIFLLFAMAIIVQMYLYCYGAEQMDEHRMDVSNTLYSCDWYLCNPKVRKLILFIMKNTQTGNLLRMPFFTPSLPLFATIVRTSGSYTAILKTFI